MPDIDKTQHLGEPSDEREKRWGAPVEEEPGHTPGQAEGEDEEASHRPHPFPDPDKTPGRAEG
jgi:hypothetical protein